MLEIHETNQLLLQNIQTFLMCISIDQKPR